MKIKNVLSAAAFCTVSVLAFSSCSKEKEAVAPVAQDEISQAVIGKIQQMGLTTADIKRVEDGYLVEGDIIITDENLANKPDYNMLRIGEQEQYRTTNLVSVGSGRTISKPLVRRLYS